MTNKPPQNKRRISTPIIIAIITLVGVCITTLGVIVVGIFPSLLDIFDSKPNKIETITFRVTEISGLSVPQAKVILLSGNDIHIQYTDSNGASTFSLIKTETLRVFVETDQYEIYDQIFSANTPNPIEIRLNPKDVSRKSVIVRVIDDKDDTPINGAEVILIVNSNIYSQITDSNGITKFTTAFPTDEIDGDISVSVTGFKSEHQRVTLQADRVQDIRLDKTSGTLFIGFTGEGKEVARTPEVNHEATIPDVNEEMKKNCALLNLTPEQCANYGTHNYLITDDIITDHCYFSEKLDQHQERIATLSIEFSEDGNTFCMNSNVNSNSICYTKTSLNTYERTSLTGGTTNYYTLKFTLNGYIDEYHWVSENNFTCEHHIVAIIQQ